MRRRSSRHAPGSIALASGSSGLRITGEAGIGKTSVWSAATELAAASGARVLAARPVQAELPLGHAGLGDVLGPVAAEVLPHLPEPQSRALAAALSLDAEPEPGDPLLVGRATVSALRLLADRSPVVIAVDDVQWLDLASVRALAFALRRVRDLPVGFAVSLRSDRADPLGLADAFGDRLVEIELAGLSLGALGRFLRARVDPDIARHSLVRIHARSAGNPFFALQLARAGDGALPQTLTELVRRQLEAVAAVGRAVIEQVAVLGPLPISTIVDTAGLDAGVGAGVLIEEGGEVRFTHPLLAAGAYERIPPGDGGPSTAPPRARPVPSRTAPVISRWRLRVRMPGRPTSSKALLERRATGVPLRPPSSWSDRPSA